MHFADTATTGTKVSLGAWLRPRMATADTVAVRTGFLTLTGLRDLDGALDDVLDRGGTIHLVVGGTEEQADPAALTELLRMSKTAGKALTVHVVTGPAFHNAKVYYLARQTGVQEAWVGSANLTRPGLASNHEAGIVLNSQDDPPEVIDNVYASVLHYQSRDAVPLTAEVIAELDTGSSTRSTGSRSTEFTKTIPFEDLVQPALDEFDAVVSRAAIEGKHTPSGIPTGFADLDLVTNGLAPGTLTVLASRPSVGRSTLARDFLRSAAIKHRHPAALYTASELPGDVSHYILAAEARIRVGDMRGGRMNDDDWTRLARRMSEVSQAPLHINCTATPDLDELTADITRLRASHDLQLAVIDPLAAITTTTEPGANREREVAIIIRRLKALALDLEIPLVVTAELGRGPDQRTIKKPQLGDLSESDTIARTADNIVLLHRPDAFERDDPRMGEADLILAKHRAGPPVIVTVAHQLHYSRFVDLAPEDQTHRTRLL